MTKMINIITRINLCRDGDFMNFNKYVKEGYELINKHEINDVLKNTFFTAIGDTPLYKEKISQNLEREEYLKKTIKGNTIYDGHSYTSLTEEQIKIYNKLNSKKNNLFSLPTSAGKSFVIIKFTKHRYKLNKRTIIIAPTISLMNEYHKKFFKENVKSSTNPFSNANILILTQERATNIKFKKGDYLIFDEAYVISSMDSRAGIAIHVIKKAIMKKAIVSMFLPNISNTKELFGVKNFSNIFNYHENFRSLSSHNNSVIPKSRREWYLNENFENISSVIFDTNVNWWKKYIKTNNRVPIPMFSQWDNEVFLYLEKEFGEQFEPLQLFKKGIGLSNGNLPKIFRYFSEGFFKNNKINLLIANSTISKGINLNINKISIFVPKIVNDPSIKIDIFELRNAVGRVGRYSSNIKDRIGEVEFVANKTTKTFDLFNNYFDEITSHAISSEKISHSKNVVKSLESYDFSSKKNYDWIEGKYGIGEKKLKEIIKKNKIQLRKYILYKYSDNKNSTTNFDNIWEWFINNIEIKKNLIFISRKKMLNNYSDKHLNSKQENFLLETIKHQGFREALRPHRTYFQSAKSELNFLKKRGDLYHKNGNISLSITEGAIKINNEMSEKDENIVINSLISRKHNISQLFNEGFLLPFDQIISKILKVNILTEDKVDKFLEEKSIPHDLKAYILSKIDLEKDDILKEIEELKIVKNIMKMEY